MTPASLYNACKIRPMQPHDVPEVMELERLSFADPWPESAYTYELFFNPLARYFVLEYRYPARSFVEAWRNPTKPLNALIGLGGLRLEHTYPLQGHISTLAVHPDWRGRGLGEWLLQTLLQQAIDLGALSVVLEVRVTNTLAQGLYEKYRFQVIDRLSGYYPNGEDAFYMLAGPLDAAYRDFLKHHQQALQARLMVQATPEEG